MKIALVRRGFSRTGGAESYLKRLGRGLADAGHQLALLATDDWPAAEWPYGGLIRLKEPTPSGFARAVAQTRRDFDVLFSLERVLACDCYRAGDGVHQVWLERRAQFGSGGWPKSLSFNRRKHQEILALEQSLFGEKQARRVITNSRMVKTEILERFGFPEDRVDIIYNGLPDILFKKKPGSRWDLRYDWGLKETDTAILFAGSGWERKGLRFALDAFRRLKERNTYLLIAGQGTKPKFIPKNVRFLGQVEDMQSLYIAADVFLLPTLYDPFSNACLEAISAGSPVITTTANGFAEVMKAGVHGDILDRPDDIERLTASLKDWCDRSRSSELRDQCAELGRKFTMETNITETLRVLEHTRAQVSAA
jgi:UDP-glucose:(heptosyl)LPS alpha-1,3-glucosyltransferase